MGLSRNQFICVDKYSGGQQSSLSRNATNSPRASLTPIAGCAGTAIFLLQIPNTLPEGFERNFESGGVGRTVVDDDDFEIGEGLGEDRIQTLCDEFSAVIGRNDGANGWGLVRSAQSSLYCIRFTGAGRQMGQ